MPLWLLIALSQSRHEELRPLTDGERAPGRPRRRRGNSLLECDPLPADAGATQRCVDCGQDPTRPHWRRLTRAGLRWLSGPKSPRKHPVLPPGAGSRRQRRDARVPRAAGDTRPFVFPFSSPRKKSPVTTGVFEDTCRSRKPVWASSPSGVRIPPLRFSRPGAPVDPANPGQPIRRVRRTISRKPFGSVSGDLSLAAVGVRTVGGAR